MEEISEHRVTGPFSSEFRSYEKPPRQSGGGVTSGKDSMPEWNLSTATPAKDISSIEVNYVQAKFADRHKISRANFDNAIKMNEAKGLVNSTVHQFPRGMQCNLIFFIFIHQCLDLTGMTQILDRDSVRIPDQLASTY